MGHSDLYATATDASRQGLQKVEGAARRGFDHLADGVDRVRTQVARARIAPSAMCTTRRCVRPSSCWRPARWFTRWCAR